MKSRWLLIEVFECGELWSDPYPLCLSHLFCFALLLVQPCFAMAADQQEAQHTPHPICKQELRNGLLRAYSAVSSLPVPDIPPPTRERIFKSLNPYDEDICRCLENSTSVGDIGESEKFDMAKAVSGASSNNECFSRSSFVSQAPKALALLIPATHKRIRTKRAPFSVELDAGKNEPSLYAGYQAPPGRVARVVFLAPGTGTACAANELCIGDEQFQVVYPDELSDRARKMFGRELLNNLQAITGLYGHNTQLTTSGRNYTNFRPSVTPGKWVYFVKDIDGVPVENTQFGKLWLITFIEKPRADPRALEFNPALATVIEVEFYD